jgi:predicted transposase/invertase (TIGR01784 family)
MQESVIYQEIKQEGITQGLTQGLTQGRTQGMEEATRLIAVNLLREGISPEQVAKCTGLSIEQVQQLQREMS